MRAPLAIRELGGAERVVSRWSSQEWFQPHDWTGDGRAIMGAYSSPIYAGMARLELWTFSHPATLTSRRVLVKDEHARIWQGRFSPNGRWLSFVVESVEDRSHVPQLAVAPAAGGVRSEWTRIAREHEWPDKPRWSPDGRTIYFVSRHNSSFFNLWGNRFDAESEEAVGEPFRVTQFDAPNRMIWPDVGSGSEIDISARHALLTMATVTGNIWMLDQVDK